MLATPEDLQLLCANRQHLMVKWYHILPHSGPKQLLFTFPNGATATACGDATLNQYTPTTIALPLNIGLADSGDSVK